MNAPAPRRQVDDPRVFGRVAVLYGGLSSERDISLESGAAVHAALAEQGVDAHLVDARDDYVATLSGEGFDRVWIALHGRGGEDGTLQGLLETLGIPYTGSGVTGSALGMDKLRCKQLFRGAGLPTPAWMPLRSAADCAAVPEQLGLPVAVKPSREGSSFGITKVATADALAAAWAQAAASDPEVLAEQWIEGAEYTAAILKDCVLPLIRIEVEHGFYDFDAKYVRDDTRFVCPCGLPAETEARLAELALDAFRAAGARGWGRVDLMVDGAGRPALLEINTVPGMTSHSLVPMAAAEAGIPFPELTWQILETSLSDAEGRAGKEADDAA